jgi:hypothetical protein
MPPQAPLWLATAAGPNGAEPGPRGGQLDPNQAAAS